MRRTKMHLLLLTLIPSLAFLVASPPVQAQVSDFKIDVRTARDVAINASGALWTIGGESAVNASIQRLVGSSLVAQPGNAVRVAVDPSGNAWVVNASGDLYHWEKPATGTETWVLSPLKAMDVAAGASGAVWAVGTDHRIMALRNGAWAAISGGGDRIAVDPAGNPWVTNANHDLWHYTGSGWNALPVKAQDVAVAPDGTVFIVGMTAKPGGFQILKMTGSKWTDVPGAVGIAVAATNQALSVAQLPQVLPLVLNPVPNIQRPPTVITNPVPVITQPTTAITLTSDFSIPVPGPTKPTPAPAPPPTTQGGLRRIFPRGGSYEAQLLAALNYGPSAGSPLDQGFANLAMLATEAYYSQQPQITIEQALSQIGDVANPTPRRAITGVIGLLLMAKMTDRSRDPATVALRGWATELYRTQKINAGKSSLEQYLAWQNDPCGYEGKPAGECMTMANLLTNRTPPQSMIALKALGSMMANQSAEVAAATTAAAVAVAGATAAAVTAASLGAVVVPGTVTSSGVVIGHVVTSLYAAFAGSSAVGTSAGTEVVTGAAQATTQVVSRAASIGSAWTGVVAAPIAAAVMVVVVGTMEGIKVVEASRVEPMLRMKLGSAMTEDIVIENALSDSSAANFFYLAFETAAANRFALPANNLDGEVRFYNQGGYVSRLSLAYRINGMRQTQQTPDLSVGNEKTLIIPAAARDIVVRVDWSDLGTWKNFYTTILPVPTFTGYTSYGTAFSPQVKNEYPEISNIIAKPNELTITQGGGYVARVRVTYKQNGQDVVAIDNSDISAGWNHVYQIPADATNIHLMAWTRTGVVWEPWHGIIDKIWPSPPNECIKVYGTTLDPKWNNECH